MPVDLATQRLYTINCSATAAVSIIVLLFTLCVFFFGFSDERRQKAVLGSHQQRDCLRLSSATWCLFVIDAVLAIAQGLSGAYDILFIDRLFYTLSSMLAWTCVTFSMSGISAGPRLPLCSFWAIYAISDVCLLVISDSSTSGDPWVICCALNQGLRACLGFAVLAYALRSPESQDERILLEETEQLLPDDAQENMSYGGADSDKSSDTVGDRKGDEDEDEDEDGDDEDNEDEREIKELQKKRLAEQGGWIGYLKGFKIFLPHIIPHDDRPTQLWVLALLIAVVVIRVVTILAPRQLGIITEELGNISETGRLPWQSLLIWGILKIPLWHGADLVWHMAQTRISQFAYKRLRSAAFAHVMSLSTDYHSQKSSGKLTKAIEQGTDLTSIFNNVFTVIPTFVDLIIATVYLTTSFDRFMGLIVVTSTVLYISISIKLNLVTSHMERVLAERQRMESEVLYDTVTNWQLVTYNNRRRFEEERYGRAVSKSVKAELKYFNWTGYAYALQNTDMDVGLVVAAVYAASKMVYGGAPLSSFVFLVSYWDSISQPMFTIAETFHETAAHLINAEWLFQLLQTQSSIEEAPGAQELNVHDGKVEFCDVTFSYDSARPVLSNINITADPGQTVALVGETGGGKSTILKLLYRLYDVASGSIRIDGQDIRGVRLDSLRNSLGIVPQDPSVFDQTILQNILYARPDATTEEVHAAARSARIHDQILSFPRGYHTRIGERGVRLSGGELQRLAIARVLLRRPRIVLLDEATSAVDSATEVQVQEAFAELGRGRTVFVVAHRLSTVVRADKIVVLEGGEIVEAGSHAELLAWDGAYARLWGMQTRDR